MKKNPKLEQRRNTESYKLFRIEQDKIEAIILECELRFKLKNHSIPQIVRYAISEAINNLLTSLWEGQGQPFRCPICGGTGIVPVNFYNSLYGFGWITKDITQPCRSCKGEGILIL